MVSAPAGSLPGRHRGVSDLERVAGAAQMQPAVDDQAAAHPDLPRHHVEQVRRTLPGAVPGFRERGQVGVVADVHPDVAVTGASQQAGQQLAGGHRMRPVQVMRGERRAVRADGRGQGQSDAERRAIRGSEPRGEQVGDQAEHGRRGGGFGQRDLVDRAEHPAESRLRDQHRGGLHLDREHGGGIGMDLDGVRRTAGRRDRRIGPGGRRAVADQRDRLSSSRRTSPVAVRVRPNRSVRSLRNAPRCVCARVSALDNEVTGPVRAGLGRGRHGASMPL